MIYPLSLYVYLFHVSFTFLFYLILEYLSLFAYIRSCLFIHSLLLLLFPEMYQVAVLHMSILPCLRLGGGCSYTIYSYIGIQHTLHHGHL